jgi:hypothetical protein
MCEVRSEALHLTHTEVDMKTLWLVVVCVVVLSVLALPAVADINIGGYARIDNYEGDWQHYEGEPESGTQVGFHSWASWTESNTSAINVSVKNKNTLSAPSEDPSQNCLYFELGGLAAPSSYAWTPTDYRLGGQGYYRVKFDWITNFTAGGQYLKLDIFFWSVSGSIWSVTPGAGYNSGHVDISMPDVEDVVFRVSVVPEPTGMAALASLAGAGVFFWRRKR